MKEKRVVITGIGALTPIGNNLKDYWNNLLMGKSGAGPITLFDASEYKTKFACEVKNFEPTNFIHRKDARKMDRFCQFAMAVSEEAISDSKLISNNSNLDRIGVIWGSGIGGLGTFYNEAKSVSKDKTRPRFNPFFIPKIIADIPAGHISIKYGFKGPNYTTVSACASSTHALINAFNYIKWGKADAFLVGGSEAAVNEPGIGGFNAMMALSTNNEKPKEASKPFDRDRDGFVLGEGAGAFVVEELSSAINRGAKIYAEIIGGGATGDAHHITAPHPQGEGAKRVMKMAIEDGMIQSNQIDYINVHGTSTPLGDVAELQAIQDLFKEHAYKLNISSTKSMTGHLLGAAGIVEAIACVMATKTNIVPPTINQFNRDDNIDKKLNLTENIKQERNIKYSLSNTFGFGGHNASVLFKKYPA